MWTCVCALSFGPCCHPSSAPVPQDTLSWVDDGKHSLSPRQALVYLIESSLRAPKASNAGDATACVGELPKKKKKKIKVRWDFFILNNLHTCWYNLSPVCHLIMFSSPDCKELSERAMAISARGRLQCGIAVAGTTAGGWWMWRDWQSKRAGILRGREEQYLLGCSRKRSTVFSIKTPNSVNRICHKGGLLFWI